MPNETNADKNRAKNIIFLMYDQLRFDYLSCYGHPFLQTPHMDWLAKNGVQFTRYYVQSPICGASRMSYLTGRYIDSHGASWNGIPLNVGEITLGEHLRAANMDSWLVGKTHFEPDYKGMERLKIDMDSPMGKRLQEGGFDIHTRDDGLWGYGPNGSYDHRASPYNDYLAQKGYDGDNPWHDYANSSIDENSESLSGWWLKNCDKPANIRNEDSETVWLTSCMIDFLQQHKNTSQPWLCHLSYIKPHWPYIVPKPYHNMYDETMLLPLVRAPQERETNNAIFHAFSNAPKAKVFWDKEIATKVKIAYMGLIKQCDDELGRLLDYLRSENMLEETIIVLTSDHGDYLGDHWMGEKDFFHEASVRAPLIIYDPSEQANSSRGTICDALTESLDLLPTFIEMAGGKPPYHVLEGRSLSPFIYDDGAPKKQDWRKFVISEYDYGLTPLCQRLNVASEDARIYMVADETYKLIEAKGNFPLMLFDLQKDPQELHNVAQDEDYQTIIAMMQEYLKQWHQRTSQRTTMSNDDIAQKTGASREKGVLLGSVDGEEFSPEIRKFYNKEINQNYLKSD